MANPNKTVDVQIDPQGNIQVDITHLEGYTEEPTITITKHDGRTTETTALFTQKVGEPVSGNSDTRSSWKLRDTAGHRTHTYDVEVVCSGTSFASTASVPANSQKVHLPPTG